MRDFNARVEDSILTGEAKRLPSTIACDGCGSAMRFVSVELGYSCINPDCSLHIEEARV